jgi:hypothetical protein
MKSIQLITLFILTLILAACNQKAGTGKNNDSSDNARSQAELDSIKKAGGHDYTFLTHQMLHYKASATMGKDPKEQPYAGQWIDFDPDGTFKAGKLSTQTHKGVWTYNHDAGVILIQPDDKNFKTSEWKVMSNDDMIVFVGTSTYGDNNTQIQLVRSDKFPE